MSKLYKVFDNSFDDKFIKKTESFLNSEIELIEEYDDHKITEFCPIETKKMDGEFFIEIRISLDHDECIGEWEAEDEGNSYGEHCSYKNYDNPDTDVFKKIKISKEFYDFLENDIIDAGFYFYVD